MVFSEKLKKQFKDLISSRSGLYFKDYDLQTLEKTVVLRTQQRRCESFEEYYSYLIASKEKESEFREIINLLTIQHTCFFRNEPQFKVLKEKVLPEILLDTIERLIG
ncbi:MAG: hypothetical protein PHQ52_00285 [Candidatus Omnitrophica bacterium]|nr:hypothetical protein [Candidatus Omnitrophota bacterium]